MKEIRRITITTTRRLRLSEIRAACPVCGCEVAMISARDPTTDGNVPKSSSPSDKGAPLLTEVKKGTIV